MSSPDVSRHIEWPAERFYWAVLDGSVLGAAPGISFRRRKTERLGYMFESLLPGVPIESIHAVYERLPGTGDRYLACGLPRSVLQNGGMDAAIADATTLGPAELPPFVDADVDPHRLNLLSGAFRPPSVRRAGRRLAITLALGILSCTALLTLGLERRVRSAAAQSETIRTTELALYERALGPSVLASVGTAFPPERRLIAELRRLEETRGASTPARGDNDCTTALAGILAMWPKDTHVLTKSLNVQASAITIQGRVGAMAEAQDLADALDAVAGWSADQPQTQTARDGVEFTLTLKPTPEPRVVGGAP